MAVPFCVYKMRSRSAVYQQESLNTHGLCQLDVNMALEPLPGLDGSQDHVRVGDSGDGGAVVFRNSVKTVYHIGIELAGDNVYLETT